METTAILPRATLAQICARREVCLAEYDRVFTLLTEANEAIARANRAAREAAPTQANRYNHHLGDARKTFLTPVTLPSREDYLETARRLTDSDIWAHLIEVTDLERLMDKRAKDELNQQLRVDPPPATGNNVVATIGQLMGDAEMIFQRGVAECFSALDRRFRSHDGWKLGSRVILTRAFGDLGEWNYYQNHRDTLRDIERAFFVLDGRVMPPAYGGVVGAVEQARRHVFGPHQTEVETEYFTLRCYKNGNAHLWFKRDDLLRQVNKLLADYYGAALADDLEREDDGGLFTPKTTPAKRYGFFPTPPAVARIVIDAARLYSPEKPLRVLEPSAGAGGLAEAAAEAGAIVDCVEIQPHLAAGLRQTMRFRQVLDCDFLMLQPNPAALYDRVIMNPPFDRERDIDHVMHAWSFVEPGGLLVAVMSAGTEFRETKKAVAFRAFAERLGARWQDLPPRSFAAAGTNCNTLIVTLRKPLSAGVNRPSSRQGGC